MLVWAVVATSTAAHSLRNHLNMMRYTQLLIASSFLFCLIAGGLCATSVVEAQGGVGVRIQPSTIDERVDPGSEASGVLTVTNENGGRQTYYIATRNVESMDDSGRPIFAKIPSDDPHEVAAWIKLDVRSTTLEVGQIAEIPYRIQVPADASPGSYFGAIFVTREAETPGESGAGVGFQVASLVNLRVNGNAVEGIKVREFSTDRQFYARSNVHFKMRIENTGTVYERPRGIIVIKDMLGREVGNVILNEKGGGVMPRNERTYETEWVPDGFLFGRLTAEATIGYGDGAQSTVMGDTSFWVIPYKEIGVVLGVGLLVVLVASLGVRAYVRKAIQGAGMREKEATTKTRTFGQRVLRLTLWIVLLVLIVFAALIAFNV